jgi:hypothetical protein
VRQFFLKASATYTKKYSQKGSKRARQYNRAKARMKTRERRERERERARESESWWGGRESAVTPSPAALQPASVSTTNHKVTHNVVYYVL